MLCLITSPGDDRSTGPARAEWAGRVLRRLVALRWEPGTFWNVNLPHPVPGGPEPRIVFCDLDPSPLPADFRIEGNQAIYTGNYQARSARLGADVAVCFGGDISVTPVRAFEAAAIASSGQTDAGAGVASDKLDALRSGRFLPAHAIMSVRKDDASAALPVRSSDSDRRVLLIAYHPSFKANDHAMGEFDEAMAAWFLGMPGIDARGLRGTRSDRADGAPRRRDST